MFLERKEKRDFGAKWRPEFPIPTHKNKHYPLISWIIETEVESNPDSLVSLSEVLAT